MKTSFLYLAPALLWACSDPAAQQAELPAIVEEQNDTTITEIPHDPFSDSLKNYFAFPVDFYTLKTKTMHMHSGGSPDFETANFHTVNDSTAQLYGYWAVEFDLREASKRSLLFATWKPWKTKQDRSYENDNETLVGIQSQIAWKELGPSDFVGKAVSEIETKFGNAHAEKLACSIYFQEEHLLILHTNEKTVDWFKYFWLNEPVINADSIPDSFLKWNNNH